MPAPMQDRLALNEARIEAMAKGVEEVAIQPDPVGRELARWTRPNGLDIARVATPIGVIGIIYEIASQCDRGCGRHRAQGRQCRHPARRFGFDPLLRRDSCGDGGRAEGGGTAGSRHPICEDAPTAPP